MVNNADWLLKLNYVEFLRDVGRHFSVNRMLTFDSVKLRLDREQSLSFLEFNYMILQGYDFVELSRRYDCRLQMGGSDQWGNIVNGIDLGHRMGTPQLYALTTPLLTTSSGAKMGKTGKRRGLAERGSFLALRFLAILAQHRGRRRRALPEDLHAPAARRDRAARRARRLRDQRGEEGARDRGDRDRAWPRGGRDRRPRQRARPSRKAPSPTRLPTVEIGRHELEAGIGMLSLFVRAGLAGLERRGAPPRPGRRGAAQRQAGHRRPPHRHEFGSLGRWRDQAVARQEEARAGQARLIQPNLIAFA